MIHDARQQRFQYIPQSGYNVIGGDMRLNYGATAFSEKVGYGYSKIWLFRAIFN